MGRSLCIHGHFYQPPREDPWLGRILLEPSAAPMRHWNERIVRESYEPVGWARRTNGEGQITDILNCYEWMSFNVGPTLLHWMERETPKVYERILEADAVSRARWGYGNAMAQAYHHTILPLASPLDKELEVAWAIADFEARFQRKPEGMWLAECAVDTLTLEVLAAHGIRFVVLAPRQAAECAEGSGPFMPVDEHSLETQRPYRVDLPSSSTMAVFFYSGGLSQAVAFEGLLQNGEYFWNRIHDVACSSEHEAQLLTLSTDGETYGHHFAFGEMALAYVLAQGYAGRDGLGLTNFATFLAANPPTARVRLHEPSSWSCVHGVERWRSNCGCTDGGHPDWNQQWRGPLRAALDLAKKALDEHFFATGKKWLTDAGAALKDYGRVLACPDAATDFMAGHALHNTTAAADVVWKLMAMQEKALAAYASCAWFFDDISRIEPVNAITFMWRAIELAEQTGYAGSAGLREAFAAQLAEAVSNKRDEGTGRDILHARVMPRQQDAASLCLMALLTLRREKRWPAAGEEATVRWPGAAVAIIPDVPCETGRKADGDAPAELFSLHGTGRIGTPLEHEGCSISWAWNPPSEREDFVTRRSFIPLGASNIQVTLADGARQARTACALPKPVRDYFSMDELREAAHHGREGFLATARHALSLVSPWEEAQGDQAYPEYWVKMAPYLMVALVFDADLSDAQRGQMRAYMQSAGLPQGVLQAAAHMMKHILLDRLDMVQRDAQFNFDDYAVLVERARELVPDMNMWTVQNAFWKLGPITPVKRRLARALGFCV